jgi:RNA polymerase sigma-70 factor (ECF subfamily)
MDIPNAKKNFDDTSPEINSKEKSLRIVPSLNRTEIASWYLKYQPELLFLAYQLLENEQEAEDVVSGLFVKLLQFAKQEKNIAALGNESELKGYLKISIRNACYDVLRRRKNQQGIIKLLSNTLCFWRNPEALEKFEAQAFELMMLELSERERSIFRLHLKGFKNSEISEQLTISELTVRNTLHNAKKRIRRLWHIFMR